MVEPELEPYVPELRVLEPAPGPLPVPAPTPAPEVPEPLPLMLASLVAPELAPLCVELRPVVPEVPEVPEVPVLVPVPVLEP